MPVGDDWMNRAGERDMTSRLVTRPRLGVVDIALQLWRSKWLMLLVFLPLFALGLLAAFAMDKTYQAQSRLLVSLGDEYVYRPSEGADAQGVTPEMEALIQSELELIRSPVVAEDALGKFPLERIYPDTAQACAEERMKVAGSDSEAQRRADYTCKQQAVDELRKHFGVGASPKTPVIGTFFTHKDPEIAAEMLNALVGSYLKYRSGIFADNNTGGFARQRERFEEQLIEAEDAIGRFLTENGLGSFESERSTIDSLYQTASNDLLTAESRLRQVSGQLASYRSQIQSIDPEQDLYVDDSSDQSLLDLKLEREEKLTRYTPESRVIAEIDKRIAAAEAYIESQDRPVGTVRRGPNPLFQEVETALNMLQAEAASLRSQQAELRSQIANFEARRQRLTELEPRYSELLRQRDLLVQNVNSFAEREVEARARSELVSQSVDNIRVLEPATVPVKGKSLKFPVAVLSLLFAAFSALVLGLIRAFTQRTFSTGKSLERTLNVPVLARIPRSR